MKKIICLLVATVFACVLSACGSAPIDCSIGELNFQLPGEYTQEQDQKVANANLDEALEAEEDNPYNIQVPEITMPEFIENDDGTISVKEGESDTDENDEEEFLRAEDFYAVQWFNGSENNVVVTAVYSPHKNDDLAGALDSIGINSDDKGYTSFEVNGSQGRHGVDSVGLSAKNYAFDIIHNGLLYNIVFFNRGEDMSETEIEDLIASINFDDTALKNQKVECGDISLTLSGEYQPLTVEEEEGWQDYKAYGKFGDNRIDFAVNYFDAAKYKSSSEMADLMKSSLSDADYSEMQEEIGKCYYLAGQYEGQDEVMAFFEKGDKVYMLEMLSEDADLSIENMQNITKTIEEK